MKRITLILLVLCLVFPATAALCESGTESISFTCTLTSGTAKSTASEIMSSSINRAILTVCLTIDLAMSGSSDYLKNNMGNFITNPSYVCRHGSLVTVIGHIEGKPLYIAYDPRSKEAGYYFSDSKISDSLIDNALAVIADEADESYKNNTSALSMVIETISEALNK